MNEIKNSPPLAIGESQEVILAGVTVRGLSNYLSNAGHDSPVLAKLIPGRDSELGFSSRDADILVRNLGTAGLGEEIEIVPIENGLDDYLLAYENRSSVEDFQKEFNKKQRKPNSFVASTALNHLVRAAFYSPKHRGSRWGWVYADYPNNVVEAELIQSYEGSQDFKLNPNTLDFIMKDSLVRESLRIKGRQEIYWEEYLTSLKGNKN